MNPLKNSLILCFAMLVASFAMGASKRKGAEHGRLWLHHSFDATLSSQLQKLGVPSHGLSGGFGLGLKVTSTTFMDFEWSKRTDSRGGNYYSDFRTVYEQDRYEFGLRQLLPLGLVFAFVAEARGIYNQIQIRLEDRGYKLSESDGGFGVQGGAGFRLRWGRWYINFLGRMGAIKHKIPRYGIDQVVRTHSFTSGFGFVL